MCDAQPSYGAALVTRMARPVAGEPEQLSRRLPITSRPDPFAP